MRRMKAFDFTVVRLAGPAKLICRFVTDTNDSITFFGNSVQEIYEQCVQKFPTGISAKAIHFSASNPSDARRNLSLFLALGFKNGYFKELPFQLDGEE